MFSAVFNLGQWGIKDYKLPQFHFSPLCHTPKQVVSFSTKLLPTGLSPSWLSLDPSKNAVLVLDDGTLLPGDYTVTI